MKIKAPQKCSRAGGRDETSAAASFVHIIRVQSGGLEHASTQTHAHAHTHTPIHGD